MRPRSGLVSSIMTTMANIMVTWMKNPALLLAIILPTVGRSLVKRAVRSPGGMDSRKDRGTCIIFLFISCLMRLVVSSEIMVRRFTDSVLETNQKMTMKTSTPHRSTTYW